jgi:toxin YoeB
MILSFADDTWSDYLYWQDQDKRILKKINRLIKEIGRASFEGIGEPKPLKYNWSGYWSDVSLLNIDWYIK